MFYSLKALGSMGKGKKYNNNNNNDNNNNRESASSDQIRQIAG